MIQMSPEMSVQSIMLKLIQNIPILRNQIIVKRIKKIGISSFNWKIGREIIFTQQRGMLEPWSKLRIILIRTAQDMLETRERDGTDPIHHHHHQGQDPDPHQSGEERDPQGFLNVVESPVPANYQ